VLDLFFDCPVVLSISMKCETPRRHTTVIPYHLPRTFKTKYADLGGENQIMTTQWRSSAITPHAIVLYNT
jgi:hypothetical protein